MDEKILTHILNGNQIFIARDKDDDTLWLFTEQPYLNKETGEWKEAKGSECMLLDDDDVFTTLNFEDGVLKAKLSIIE